MGGKKKAKKPEPRKKAPKLSIYFTCPICNIEKTVSCKLNFDIKRGSATCSKCKASFETDIKMAFAPADVYTRWIDELEAANKPGAVNEDAEYAPPPAKRQRVAPGARDAVEDEAADGDDGEEY